MSLGIYFIPMMSPHLHTQVVTSHFSPLPASLPLPPCSPMDLSSASFRSQLIPHLPLEAPGPYSQGALIRAFPRVPLLSCHLPAALNQASRVCEPSVPPLGLGGLTDTDKHHSTRLAVLGNVCTTGLPLNITEEAPPETSPVIQWIRTPLPMQGTRVRSLVRDDQSHRPRSN